MTPRWIITILLLFLAVQGLQGLQGQTLYAVVLGNPKYVVGSSTLRSGLFMSRDTGRSWTHLGPQNLKAYAMDAVDSSRGRILFIAAGNGVHKSTDYGATWRITTDWRMTEVMDLRVDQSNPRYVYAATAFGFWRSADGGESWERSGSMVRDIYIYSIDLGDDVILLSGESAIYGSTDRGESWERSAPIPGPRGIYRIPGVWLVASSEGPLLLSASGDSIHAYPFAPPKLRMNTYAIAGNSMHAYAAGEGGILSMMLAAKEPYWRDITGELPNRAVHALALVGNDLIIGTFGDGIFRRVDGAWAPSGLEGSQVWSLEVKGW